MVRGLVRVGGARPKDPGRICLGIGGTSNSKLRRGGRRGEGVGGVRRGGRWVGRV